MIFLTTISCNNWFDTPPEGNGMGGAEVFNNESSFRDYMNGIYTGLRSNELYGENLTLGGLELLSQSFVPYQEAKAWCKLSLNDPFTINLASEVYAKLYAAIYQCNDILERFEQKKELYFIPGSREMMIAEAKALRAFLHFELVRLFSPSAVVDSSVSRILWVDNIHRRGTTMTTAELTQKVISELDASAQELEKYDPIVTGNGYDENSLLGTLPADRMWKLNYYAVLAAQARALMSQNTAEAHSMAYQHLMTIIDSQKYGFVRTISDTDYSFSTESIFALPSGKAGICAVSKSFFGAGGLGVTFSSQVTVNDLGADDRRRKWFDTDNTMFTKFAETSTIANWKTPPAIPVIKIGEVWLLAAESAMKSNRLSEGVLRFNKFIEQRNSLSMQLPENASAEALKTAIDTQYRYEFLGEGVRFLYCKRLNDALTAYDGTSIAAVGGFSLPIVQ